ncbi:hypothetical protein MLD38_037129 [Melastoma candidum]|uniref:Uncharacterized protein n=1 Tax=Melastoma candidum TaxID=119954 RepID=A0ACB9LM29_9MYRT|nr:hypothetical protein MLD38_037129 [Melastoma candidum]
MGSKGGGGGGGGSNGVPAVIPAGARKIVQSLKEIVNCPEQEIYTALKECNMDPNEAVNRLLSQDPFHEVKSKREKKKEVKETTESRPRSVVASSRGGRTSADRYTGRNRTNIPSTTVTSDSSKPTLKKENGSYATPISFASAISGPNINRKAAYSDNFSSENKAPTFGKSDLISSSIQPSPGFPRAWVGTPDQVSMADIVKMGKPLVKSPGAPNRLAHHPMASGSHDDFQLHDQSSKLCKSEPRATSQQVPSNEDDWPLDEHQAPPPNEDEWPSFENSPDGSGQHVTSRLEGGPISEDGHIDVGTNHMGFASVSNRNILEDDGRDPSLYENNSYKHADAFQPHMHAYEHNEDDYAEDVGVGAVSTNFQHLSLQKNEQGSVPEDDGPAVVIPDHLQVHPSDCQHLSFGSFAPSIGAISESAGSGSLKGSFPEAQPLPDASSDSHPDIRNSEQYGDEHLRPTSSGNDTHGGVPNGGNYEAASASQPEALQQHPGESAVGTQYQFPSAASEYSHEISQALDSTFAHTQDGSSIQNLPPFSNVLQSYTNSLPGALLASTVQTGRESDLSYLPFPVTQPLATKYSNAAPSLNNPLMSTPEGLRAGSVSAAQQPPQSIPTTGLGLPQHLAMHAYSQPALSLGPFANMANMVGYHPFLHQSYSYMPSAFQQAFASNNTYHQSVAAILPQYKSSLSAGNLPHSGAIASGYGFNSSSNVPGGNFQLNPQADSTTLGYEDALSSQYKDANNLLSLQQNDNSGMWVSGAAARAAPNLPASNYYNFPGQNQLAGEFRQAQQPSQHFGSLGYPNYYQSASISPEQQQQLMRDSTFGGSQGQQSKQSSQIWQNTY